MFQIVRVFSLDFNNLKLYFNYVRIYICSITLHFIIKFLYCEYFLVFFAYHMLALYSLVGLIFCASSVFFVVHGAPLEVPSFLYYLVQFGAAALHFRFRFQ